MQFPVQMVGKDEHGCLALICYEYLLKQNIKILNMLLCKKKDSQSKLIASCNLKN